MQIETETALLWWKMLVYPMKIEPTKNILLGSLYYASLMDIEQDMVNLVMTKARKALQKTDKPEDKVQQMRAHITEHQLVIQWAVKREIEDIIGNVCAEVEI